MKDNIHSVGQDLYVLRGAGAVVQFTGGKDRDVNFSADELKLGNIIIAPWGKNNLKQQEMLKLVAIGGCETRFADYQPVRMFS
ncbi:hypothetical protein F0P96_18160 [Hymenobacter busanensis]|uniref:Uncharacterized protein n=1 Tax=Hymenobacter busanensis TaxID=2607656 RepID=A0A7L4ZSF6_9BACT|nr:hypothetical protein [Hymenobacter busanensis]KAA9327161.1 hypothetical protein F0P96_18160 [Hymenobacter busanensis]QHJ05827.1 hypothetical protein GUY19_00360 [Hymenobacter busanensis]